MALKLDGLTGYLECASAVVATYPFTMLMWVSRDSSANDNVWLAQGQSNADRYARVWHLAASENKYITLRNPGSSVSKTKATAPNASTALQLVVGVFNSASDRTLYFGDANGVQDTSATVNDIASYDRTVIGANHFNGGAATLFMNGSVAEAHFYNAALTAANITSILSGTKPETLSGWVDGWTLETYSAGGTYASMGGTRTMTATGSVTASGQTHPINRTPPDTIAPTFTGTLVVTPGSTTATVDWSGTTHTDNVGITSYDWSLDNSSWTNTGGTATSVGLTGLTPNTNYTAYVRANDAAGNHSAVLSQAFTTTAAGDSTAPTMNGSITLSAITKSGAHAVWVAASDNVGVTGYEISVDTGTASWTPIGNVLSYDISGVPELSSRTFRVRAFDAAGNKATPLTATLNTIGASFTFDTMANNTTTIWKNQAVVWNWWPGGRIGALAAITPKQGSGTIDASGVLTITGVLPTGAGMGLVAKQNTSANDDNVFYQAGTAS